MEMFLPATRALLSEKNHGVLIENFNDARLFCGEEKRFIIFPEREPLPIAKDLCTSHGGQIIVPQSLEENNEMMRVLNKHKHVCMDEAPTNVANTGLGSWLGLQQEDNVWYFPDENGIKRHPNFTNWGNTPDTITGDACSFANKHGTWGLAHAETCLYFQLCTICQVIGNPVFTFNGFCSQSSFDYNYYLAIDDQNTIVYYEGYKITNLVKENDTWIFTLKSGKGAKARMEYNFGEDLTFPVGRRQWSIYDPLCGIKETQNRFLSMSNCRFGEEFTCDSGNCIKMQDRCDQVPQCDDSSDENGCKMVHLPQTYRKVQPPEPVNSSKPLRIKTFIKIVSIDIIDTINMKVGLTLSINMKWRDSRLTFANLITNSENMVRQETAEELWIPLQYVTHDNALIGEIHPDSKMSVEVQPLELPLPMKIGTPIQNTLYSGANNVLEFKQRYRLVYKCTFTLREFPFDHQICVFVMKMKIDKFSAVSFEKDHPAITYVGSNVVQDFEIEEVLAYTGMIEKHTTFNFTIKMERIFTDQLITTFFPTCLLWLLAYFTLFIKVDDFTDRIMVSITVLLVLAALLSSIKGSIPATSYFKYIDIWFLWYTAYIFAIAVLHILLDQMNTNTYIAPLKKKNIAIGSRGLKVKKLNKKSRKERINDIAKTLLLLPFILFNVIYFFLQY